MPAMRYGTNLWMDPLSCTAPETPWATLILSASLQGERPRESGLSAHSWAQAGRDGSTSHLK